MTNETHSSDRFDAKTTADTAKETWEKPEILSFEPVRSAQGISYTPSDGISNLTP